MELKAKLTTNSPAPALDRGLAIVELLAEKKTGLGFGQLQKALGGLNATTLTRLLRVLEARQYLQKDPHSSRYTLAAKLSLFARSTSTDGILLQEAPGLMQDLSDKFAVTVLLIRFAAGKMVCLEKVVHPDNVAMQAVGTISESFHTTPWGLLYLTSSQGLASKYVNENFADDLGQLASGMRRLSAPIFNFKKELVAALNIGSVEAILTTETLQELIPALVSAAQKLSLALGFGGERNDFSCDG